MRMDGLNRRAVGQTTAALIIVLVFAGCMLALYLWQRWEEEQFQQSLITEPGVYKVKPVQITRHTSGEVKLKDGVIYAKGDFDFDVKLDKAFNSTKVKIIFYVKKISGREKAPFYVLPFARTPRYSWNVPGFNIYLEPGKTYKIVLGYPDYVKVEPEAVEIDRRVVPKQPAFDQINFSGAGEYIIYNFTVIIEG